MLGATAQLLPLLPRFHLIPLTMSSTTPAPYCAPSFGQTLLGWQRLNNWSQQDIHALVSAHKFPGPYNSQWSVACRGCHDPKPGFFVGLGLFNQAVADHNLPGSIPRARRDRFIDAQPLILDDGRIATAVDFFALYLGVLPCPQQVANVPLPEEKSAKAEPEESAVASAAAAIAQLSPEERLQLVALLS
jgi:hypothetical protein